MTYQITDPVELGTALNKLVKYCFRDELKNFEECFSDEFDGFNGLDEIEFTDEDETLEFEDEESLEVIGKAIKTIRKIKGGQEHIFYSILVLISGYSDSE